MATTIGTEDVLDNPAWHSLRGRLARFAEGGAGAVGDAEALRFDPEVALFSAVERMNATGWRALASLVGLDGLAILFRDRVPSPPEGWLELFRFPTLQFVADALPEAPELDLVLLGEADAPEMLALTQLTEPGPFVARTFELGRYIGVRREGRLMAMAGERFRMPGYVEVSAVCAHPDARREGLGAALTLHVAHSIRAGGDEACLHVLETNENAIRLYRKLGFQLRRKVDVVGAQWIEDAARAETVSTPTPPSGVPHRQGES